MEKKIEKIINEFNIEGKIEKLEVIHNGNINSTNFVSVENNGKKSELILQKINKYVFKKPDEVMENIVKVTEHIMQKLKNDGKSLDRKTLHFFNAKSGKSYVVDEDGDYWRLCDFIADSKTFDLTDDLNIIEECGRAFGEFQGLLADFPAEELNITIPHFHNTANRYKIFKEAIQNDFAGRGKLVKKEIDEFLELESVATKMCEMQKNGELKLKVTHNDTKSNNVMFDKETNKFLCVIDLDTVMPGLLGHDFGDAIRFIANTAAEDEADLSKVEVDIKKFEAFATGFLKEVCSTITEAEKNTLVLGSIIMTLEVAVRFLTDYLDGDKYFKTLYPEHNIVRARCQLKLAQSMLENQDKMNAIVDELYAKLTQERVELSIKKKFKKELFTRFAKAINEYDLIKPNDKIAVCISGGKDSMLLAKLFQELKNHNKFEFELVFLAMNPGYNDENFELIVKNSNKLGIPLTIFDSEIFSNVEHIDKSPCYVCARMRRGYLYNKAKELGCNKIALGHHYDDVIETILMGMLYGAQIQTMMPKLHSTNFEGMELIRPMYLIREKDIKKWRDYNNLKFLQCACRFTADVSDAVMESKRQEVKELIDELTQKDEQVAGNIFKSVENVNLSTVIAYKDKNGNKHNFKDEY